MGHPVHNEKSAPHLDLRGRIGWVSQPGLCAVLGPVEDLLHLLQRQEVAHDGRQELEAVGAGRGALEIVTWVIEV